MILGDNVMCYPYPTTFCVQKKESFEDYIDFDKRSRVEGLRFVKI